MLKKLSLAALVAMGSMSVASATDLSEAIKGVELKGFVRLRVYHDANSDTTDHLNRYRTTTALNFAIPVDDAIKFHTDYAYDWNMYEDASTTGKSYYGNTHFFVDYTKNKLNLLVGKIAVATPVTGKGVGEALGAGALATYGLNDNVTLAAAGLDTLANTDQVPVGGKNTYAGAVIYNSADKKVSVQAWIFKVENLINRDVIVMANVKASDNLSVHFDYANADLDDSVSKYIQTFKNVNVTYTAGAVSAKVGFAANGVNGAVVSLDHDSPIASVFATEQITGIASGTKGDKAVYAKVGYKVDAQTNAYVAYTKTDDSGTEALVGAKYAYSPKFNVGVYYSVLSKDDKEGNRETRAEFKYSF